MITFYFNLSVIILFGILKLFTEWFQAFLINSIFRGKLIDGWYKNRASPGKVCDINVNIKLWISLTCPRFFFTLLQFFLILHGLHGLTGLFTLHGLHDTSRFFQSTFLHPNKTNDIPLNLICCSCWVHFASSKFIFERVEYQYLRQRKLIVLIKG